MRTKEWVAMAAGRLKVLVKEIVTLVSHSNWRVRLSLADGAATLLKTCARYVVNSLFAAGVLIMESEHLANKRKEIDQDAGKTTFQNGIKILESCCGMINVNN